MAASTDRTEDALVPDGECGEDYVLRDGHDWVWIQIGVLVVRLSRDGETGVIVECFEDVEGDPIAGFQAAPGETGGTS